MSELQAIQSNLEAKRVIKGVHFDWDHPEVTYTSPSQGGAASLKNDAYIFKAAKATKEDLDETQESILKQIGEEFTTLEKSKDGNNQTPSSSSEDVDGEETQVNKGNNMTDVTREEFVELQKALAVEKAKNSITVYAFEADLNKAVAGAVATLSDEDKEAITKAFDALIARGEAEVEKAKAVKPEEESELSKALADEAGEAGEAEEDVEKSLATRARESQDNEQAKIQGAK